VDGETLGALWNKIDLGVDYSWPVKKSAASKLAALGGACPPDGSRDELSAFLGPQLRGANAQDVACWIVRDWGGIRGIRPNTIAQFLIELTDFSDDTVEAFVQAQKMKNISSWSKILAFRDSDRWAIYDSRTAVALNAAFMAINCAPTFPMPVSRNTKIEPKRRIILNRAALTAGYREYLQLLGELRDHRGLRSISEAEKVLFANAEAIVQFVPV